MFRLLAIWFLMIVGTGAAFGQTGIEMWIEASAVAGPLESLTENNPETECGMRGTLTYPVLHPMPMNSDGTPAICLLFFQEISAQMEHSAKAYRASEIRKGGWQGRIDGPISAGRCSPQGWL